MSDLNRKMARGAAWMVLLKLFERSIGMVSTMILARLLVPADFGLMALATSIIAVLELFGAFSFDLALIQRHGVERRYYDTVWSFKILFAAGCALVMTVGAEFAAGYFAEPRLEGVLYWLAVSYFIGGFGNIGVIAFQKDLDLHREFVRLIGKKLVTFAVTVIIAYSYRSYWALVAGTVIGIVFSVAQSYWMHPYRPKWNLSAMRELMGFSGWMLLNNLVIFVNNRSLDFIIGKFSGAANLGRYSIAYEISNLPTTELVYPITRAVFPGYAKLRGDPAALRASFLDVFALVALLTVPIGFGIQLLAEPLVYVMLGRQWLDLVPLIQTLALFGVTRALQANTGAMYLALGLPRMISITSGLHVVISIPLFIYWLFSKDIDQAVWATVIAAVVSMPVNFGCLLSRLGLRWIELVGAVWRVFAAVACMSFALHLITPWLWSATDSGFVFLRFLALVLFGVGIYVVSLFAIWRILGAPEGAERKVFGWLATRVQWVCKLSQEQGEEGCGKL